MASFINLPAFLIVVASNALLYFYSYSLKKHRFHGQCHSGRYFGVERAFTAV